MVQSESYIKNKRSIWKKRYTWKILTETVQSTSVGNCVCVWPGDAYCMTDVHLSKLRIVSIHSIDMDFTCQLFLIKVLFFFKMKRNFTIVYIKKFYRLITLKMYYIIWNYINLYKHKISEIKFNLKMMAGTSMDSKNKNIFGQIIEVILASCRVFFLIVFQLTSSKTWHQAFM